MAANRGRAVSRYVRPLVLAAGVVAALASGGRARMLGLDPHVPQSGGMAFVALQDTVAHIFLMDVNRAGVGSRPVRLTKDAETETYPSWSPDGKSLAYQRAFDGSAVYTIDADGTNERRLSPTPGFDVTPSWSPDGSRIVYARLHAAPKPGVPPVTDIRIMNVDGTGDRAVLANTRFSVEPRWSVENKIVFMSYLGGNGLLDIYEINVDGSGLRRLTSAGNNGDPVWSPNGKRITFGSDREGGGKLNIFAMNADGSDQVQLTHFRVPDEAGDTNWSSDGTSIGFEFDVDGMKQSNPKAFAQVWTMNADGSNERSTGVRCSDVGCGPRWQPRLPVLRPLQVSGTQPT